MTTFFGHIMAMTPGLSPREASDRLNGFEAALFDDMPLALGLNEAEQDGIVETLYSANFDMKGNGQ